MDCFNQELIKNVKLAQSENGADDISEEKYAFIQYVFSKIESISMDSIEICDEEFEELNVNLDAYYFDEDANVYNLYLAIYSNQNDDNSFLAKEQALVYYNKIINFLKKTFFWKIR